MSSQEVNLNVSETNVEQQTEEQQTGEQQTGQQQAEEQQKSSTDAHRALMMMPIDNQNAALNGLIGFVGIAQRRGCFALDEAAKAFECIKMFHNPSQ